MILSRLHKILLLGCFISIGAAFAYPYLPQKHRVIHLKPEALIDLWDDSDRGGNSVTRWVEQEKFLWECELKDAIINYSCGFNLMLTDDQDQGLDLSEYQQVIFRLSHDYLGQRLRVYLINRLNHFTAANQPLEQFSFIFLNKKDMGTDVVVDLREFAVAEWWLSQHDVPRQYNYPHLDNIRALGLEIVTPEKTGIYRAQLQKLEFIGPYVSAVMWYRSILVFWTILLAGYGISHYLQLHAGLAREKIKLAQLAAQNNQLLNETDSLRSLSTTDNLTGVLNRHGLEQALAQNLAHSYPIAMLIIDLDHFKRVNDKRGHAAGDLVLQTLASLMKQNLRQGDVLARWGGEEFIVLIPHTDSHAAMLLAEKLRQHIADCDFSLEPRLKVTASFGVGCLAAGEDFALTFKRIDAALYKAKHAGRNCVMLAQTPP